MPQVPIAGPISPKLIRKVEKEILAEAKNEEKHLKHAIQDLTQDERNEHHAQKAVFKADSALQRAGKNEQRTLQDMYRAEHTHDVALSKAQEEQKALESSKIAHEKAKETLRQESIYVEQAMKTNDENTKTRNEKLAVLRKTDEPKAISEIISESSATRPVDSNPTNDAQM